METSKGGMVLIDALPHLMRSVQRPVRVTMAGDGRDRARWEARAAEIEKATPNVQFTFPGWLAQDELGMLMKNSDLLVVPSLWPEPFGSVGPAAGQHGLPAAGFAVGAFLSGWWMASPDTWRPGDPPTSDGLALAIRRCLEDPIHYTSLREGALQMARTFTMTRHMPELMKAFAAI